MLIKGNSKLGKTVYHFSLPVHVTCPGETAACASVCYAKDGFFRLSNVKKSLRTSWKRSKRADFAEKMVAAIGRREMDVLRIHVSGDFYNADYVRKWTEIAKRCPKVKFYTYTRSWRIADMLDPLLELAALPNVRLWWSVDITTHENGEMPPVAERTRVAYMQLTDAEPVPSYTDLVFRVTHKTFKRRIDGKQVCPVESGMKYAKGKRPTCSSCKLCYRTRAQLALVSAG